MELGAFISGLLTGLREGVEAALIVAIVLAYLARTGNRRHFPKIWAGTAAAVAVSAVLGIIIFAVAGGLQEPWEQLFEGVTMLVAAAIVTWMLFWMRRQAASVRSELHAAVDRVLTEGTVFGLAALAFTAVIREGIETAVFLTGQATAAAGASEAGAGSVLVGALIGLAIAIAIGWGFYRGTRVVNLPTFFRWTGIALIFIAAGLLSHAVHEFIEVAEATGIALPLTQTAFDLSGVLPHEVESGEPMTPAAVVGLLLRALVGYSSTPEWLTLIVHVAYLVTVLVLYLRPLSAAAPTGERRNDRERVAGT